MFALAVGCSDPAAPKVSRPANAVDVVLNFCFLPPTWLAVKNDGYEWTAVPTAGFATQYQVPVTPKVTIAFGFASEFEPGYSEVHVFNITAQELADMTCGPPLGLNQMTASVAGVGADDGVSGSLGPGFGYLLPGEVTMNFITVPSGLQDLVAQHRSPSYAPPDKYIVRHDVTVSNFGTLATLDFSSAEAVAPVPVVMAAPGASDWASTYITNRGAVATLMYFGFTQDSATVPLIPASVLAPGDGFSVSANSATRYVTRYFASPVPQTIALGPALSTPTITTVASTPSLLMRAELPSQAEYPSLAVATFGQGADYPQKTISVVMTSGYLGGTPATWALEIPDLTKVITKDLLLSSGVTTSWTVEAWDARMPLFFNRFGANDGETVRCATASSASALSDCHSPITLPFP